MIMLPSVIKPPAPNPQKALANIRLSIVPANAHQVVAKENSARHPTKMGLRPTASERRPSSGWKAVEVKRKAVESQDAELAALKYEVITGCEDAMIVVSKQTRNCTSSTCENMDQNRAVDVPPRNGQESDA